MNLTDLLIIYLAFGAPIAVYKYLQTKSEIGTHRVLSSLLTFVFWLPAAVRIGYLYFTNANLEDAFVSQSDAENEEKRICVAREALATELVRMSRGLSVHDVRDTVERYAGLADAVRSTDPDDPGLHPLLAAAGRTEDQTGAVCLNRRNRNRLERHYKWARQDFLMLFEYLGEAPGAIPAFESGLELTRLLDDEVADEQLRAAMLKRGEVWTEEHDQVSARVFSKPVAQLVISGPSTKAD